MPGGGGNAYRHVLASFCPARRDGNLCFAPGRNQVGDVQTRGSAVGLIDELNPRARPSSCSRTVVRQECDNQIACLNVCRQVDPARGAVTCVLRRLRTYNSWKSRKCFLNLRRELENCSVRVETELGPAQKDPGEHRNEDKEAHEERALPWPYFVTWHNNPELCL